MRRLSQDEIRDRILYKDHAILVFHKPAGLPVQSADSGMMDLESLLRTFLDGKPPRIVHRLDQPVEGIVVLALSSGAAADLSRQLAGGEMKKVYKAAVCPGPGIVLPGPGETRILEDVLIRDGRSNTSRVALPGETGGKQARLKYEIVGRTCSPAAGESECMPIARITLMTGRHHQIRVQFAHAGMPLAGDTKYGGVRLREGLALCACSLTFRHPESGREMCFEVSPEHPLLLSPENTGSAPDRRS